MRSRTRSKKLVTTQAKRETASFLVERWSLSVRQACRLVHLSRTVFHYQAVPNDDNEVREALRELARKHPKYGCPMLTGILRARGFAVNHKRVERIYQEENLALRRKRKGKKVVVERTPLAPRQRRSSANGARTPWLLAQTPRPAHRQGAQGGPARQKRRKGIPTAHRSSPETGATSLAVCAPYRTC